MNRSTIRHGIYKNLSSDTVFNSQVGMLVFFIGVAFKLSTLPHLIAETFGSSAFWVFLVYSMIDVCLSLGAIYFSRSNGDAILVSTGSVTYRALCFFAMIWLTLKGVFYFSYASSYLTHELFEGLEPSLIYILFIIPIVYLGLKGVRTIARTGEVFFFFVFLVAILNVVFIKTKMDFARVLPIFSKEPSILANDFARYGLALGDCFPLVFLRIKNKRLPYFSAGVVGTWIFANLIMLLGVATYGEGLKTVTDLFIHLAGFNQLSKDVGRMEWTNLFAMLTATVISLSFTFFGATAASERALKSGLPAKVLFPATILACILFVPSAESITAFATNDFGYFMFCMPPLLILTLLFTHAYAKRKTPNLSKLLDEEYLVSKKEPTVIPSDKRGLLQPLPKQNSQL